MLTRSEKILAVANFVLVKHPDAPAETKSKLYRALGAMYVSLCRYAGDSEAVAREFCSLRLCWSELAIARFFYVRGWLTVYLDYCDACIFFCACLRV